jgi:hypothetical protein
MRRLGTTTLLAVAVMLAMAGPGHAQGMATRGSAGGMHDGDGRHESDGHHPGDHDGDRDGRHDHRRFVWGGPAVYGNYPYYAYYVPPARGYWYYCPSAEAYYPYVTNCLDAWVPVPAP